MNLNNAIHRWRNFMSTFNTPIANEAPAVVPTRPRGRYYTLGELNAIVNDIERRQGHYTADDRAFDARLVAKRYDDIDLNTMTIEEEALVKHLLLRQGQSFHNEQLLKEMLVRVRNEPRLMTTYKKLLKIDEDNANNKMGMEDVRSAKLNNQRNLEDKENESMGKEDNSTNKILYNREQYDKAHPEETRQKKEIKLMFQEDDKERLAIREQKRIAERDAKRQENVGLTLPSSTLNEKIEQKALKKLIEAVAYETVLDAIIEGKTNALASRTINTDNVVPNLTQNKSKNKKKPGPIIEEDIELIPNVDSRNKPVPTTDQARVYKVYPGFKTGGRVKKTGKALIHKDEFVLPKGVKATKKQKQQVAKIKRSQSCK